MAKAALQVHFFLGFLILILVVHTYNFLLLLAIFVEYCRQLQWSSHHKNVLWHQQEEKLKTKNRNVGVTVEVYFSSAVGAKGKPFIDFPATSWGAGIILFVRPRFSTSRSPCPAVLTKSAHDSDKLHWFI
ncbi:unnamed protein product [Amoebophrya sp. A120]|nr:unnamed protein product [Amoebophrya sp. A120]|eukprot:GSA120T00017206001.1